MDGPDRLGAELILKAEPTVTHPRLGAHSFSGWLLGKPSGFVPLPREKPREFVSVKQMSLVCQQNKGCCSHHVVTLQPPRCKGNWDGNRIPTIKPADTAATHKADPEKTQDEKTPQEAGSR